MIISNAARQKFKLESKYLAENSTILAFDSYSQIQQFTDLINEKQKIEGTLTPETTLKSSEINALSILSEINNELFQYYEKNILKKELDSELFHHLIDDLGEKKVYSTIQN